MKLMGQMVFHTGENRRLVWDGELLEIAWRAIQEMDDVSYLLLRELVWCVDIDEYHKVNLCARRTLLGYVVGGLYRLAKKAGLCSR